MKRSERIFVPVDLGPNTDPVVASAATLALALDARVQLAFVIGEVPHFVSALGLMKQAAWERLEELNARLVGQGAQVDPPLVLMGSPCDTITRTAERVNAHMIVLGRGGSGSGFRSALGSTASRVMRRSCKAVFAVPADSDGKLRRILCPVDSSDTSARGLRNAIKLAHALEARLTVMTAITQLSLPAVMAQRMPDMTRLAAEYGKREREEFEQFIERFDFGDLRWDREVHYGDAAPEIVRLATSAKYDLIIMGSTGRSGVPRLLMGSTAENVARHSPCSVLTVKREDVLSADLEEELTELNRLLGEGEDLMEQAQYELAIGRFDQCLARYPYNACALEGQAAAHEHLGHHETATELQEQAALIRRQLWHQKPNGSEVHVEFDRREKSPA